MPADAKRPYAIQQSGACSWDGTMLETSTDVVVVEYEGPVPRRLWRAQHRVCLACEMGVLINFEDQPWYVFGEPRKAAHMMNRIRKMYVEGVSLFYVNRPQRGA